MTGYTNSADLPEAAWTLGKLTPGSCGSSENEYACVDAFVAKLDPTGQRLVYLAYLGGSGDDFATSIAIDAVGNAYITGYTNSVDLPTTSAVQPAHAGGDCSSQSIPCFDAFVAKLNSAGSSWTYATYLGGNGDDLAQSIGVDEAGSAVITGTTASLDFPTRRPLQADWEGGASEGFVAKLDPSGAQLTFATFLGGSGDDFATSLALGPAGDIYVAGYTNSPDLVTTDGLQPAYAAGTCGALGSTFPCFDAYVARVAPDGSSLSYLTFLGGTGADYAYAVATDDAGNATVAGMTTSQDFPVTFGAFKISGGGSSTDAFVARVDPLGTSLIYSTYLGGSGPDMAAAVGIDGNGRTFVAGTTYGSGFPVVNPVEAGTGGFYDLFLAVLGEDGTRLQFSSNLGGTGNDKAHGLAVDRIGNAYLVAETFSTNFPTVRAFQPNYGGGAFDGTITKVALGESPVLYATPSQIDFGNQLVGTRSDPRGVIFANIGGGELHIERTKTSGEFESSGDCTSLPAGASCEVQLVFTPSVKGSQAGSLEVVEDGIGEMLHVNLTGVGIAPAIQLSTASVDFDPQLVGTESGPEEIILANPGTVSLQLSGISTRGDFVQSNDCPSSLPVDGNCTIRVRFRPEKVGDHEGALVVTNSLPEETKSAILAGIATDFALKAHPEEITVAAGEAAAFNITVTPLGGFRESLSFACTGAPKAASCSISQERIVLDGSNPLEVRATVSTTAGAVTSPPTHSPAWPPLYVTLILLTFSTLAGLISRNRSYPLRLSPRLGLVMIVLFFAAACGGGGGISRSTGIGQGTPPGTYALTVAASCEGVTRNLTVSLVVR